MGMGVKRNFKLLSLGKQLWLKGYPPYAYLIILIMIIVIEGRLFGTQIVPNAMSLSYYD